MFNNTRPRPASLAGDSSLAPLPPVAVCICLQPPLLFIVYIEIFASIFQKFSIVVTAQQTAHICQTIFNKVLSCILLLYLELKSSTNRPVFAFVLFLYNSVSTTGHISHSHICRTTKLLPGCPNICSKLGIRKQFGVFSKAEPGHWE